MTNKAASELWPVLAALALPQRWGSPVRSPRRLRRSLKEKQAHRTLQKKRKLERQRRKAGRQ